MSAWSEEQDDVLREVCYLGPERAAEEIWRRCGVRHTPGAVQAHGSRIHCSTARRTVCPSCGAVGVNLNKATGMCRLCSERYHVEQEKIYLQLLEEERRRCEDSPEVEEARRERDRLRQRASRLKRRHGLETRRPRNRKGPPDAPVAG